MSRGLRGYLTVGNTPITATLNGISGSTTVTVTAATLLSIIVTPANPSLPAGTTKFQMTATAVFSDGTTQDVTQQANWTSSDSTVAFIISSSSTQTNGRLDAKTTGTATINCNCSYSRQYSGFYCGYRELGIKTLTARRRRY
jgi:hypothetical protein